MDDNSDDQDDQDNDEADSISRCRGVELENSPFVNVKNTINRNWGCKDKINRIVSFPFILSIPCEWTISGGGRGAGYSLQVTTRQRRLLEWKKQKTKRRGEGENPWKRSQYAITEPTYRDLYWTFVILLLLRRDK